MNILIEIDYRERDSGIIDILRAKGNVNIEEKRLFAGDYLINRHIAVERKTTRDFVLSIIDGRLFSQAHRLKKHADVQLMVIEGSDLFSTGYEIDPQAVKGAIVSLSVSWQIPLLFSKTPEGTAGILVMASFQGVKYRDEILKRAGRRPSRLLTRKLFLLQGLPGIGPKMARRMLEHFGSVEKVIVAGERELSSMAGIGRKKASVIREVVK